MIYFANPSTEPIRAAMVAHPSLGYIDTPLQQTRRPAGVEWVADNGCFGKGWNEDRWWRWLQSRTGDAATCRFAVAPDVVADAAATEARSRPWLDRIRALGFPVAYVAQDGMTVPAPSFFDDVDALFLGGSTEFKLGPVARELTAVAVSAGTWVHMGRVNSERRWRYADAIGVSSCDGTYLTYGPDVNLPHLLAWCRNNDQLTLH